MRWGGIDSASDTASSIRCIRHPLKWPGGAGSVTEAGLPGTIHELAYIADDKDLRVSGRRGEEDGGRASEPGIRLEILAREVPRKSRPEIAGVFLVLGLRVVDVAVAGGNGDGRVGISTASGGNMSGEGKHSDEREGIEGDGEGEVSDKTSHKMR